MSDNLIIISMLDRAREKAPSPEAKALSKALRALADFRAETSKWEAAISEVDGPLRLEGEGLAREQSEQSLAAAAALLKHVTEKSLHANQYKKAIDVALDFALEAIEDGFGGEPAHALFDELQRLRLQLDGTKPEEVEAVAMEEMKAAFEEQFGVEVDIQAKTAAELGEALSKLAAEFMREESREHDEAQAARERSAQRKQERADAKKKAKPKTETEEASETTIKELFRRLAKALHPDKAVSEEERSEKDRKMREVNEARDSGDFAKLLSMSAEEGLLDADGLSSKAADVLDSYVKMIKKQAAAEKEKLASFTLMAMQRVGRFVNGPDDLLKAVKRDMAEGKAFLAERGTELAKLSDNKAARVFLKSMRRA